MKQHKRVDNYMTVMLGRKTSPLYVHRLVATAFLENPDSLPQVDHINGDKTNNKVENLRWLTVSENNCAYGQEQRRKTKHKKVRATNGKETIVFSSRLEAGEYFHCHSSKIKYDHLFEHGEKAGWIFERVKDIV